MHKKIILSAFLKPHLHGRLFCNVIRRFFYAWKSRGHTKNGGTRGGISWWHFLSAKMQVKTKKKGPRCKTSWFLVRKYVITKKKVFAYRSVGFRSQKNKKKNKWFHPKMETPGAGSPCKNLSRRVVTHTRQDSLAAIAFEKNRCRASNTSDLRCQLYFAILDARIVLPVITCTRSISTFWESQGKVALV